MSGHEQSSNEWSRRAVLAALGGAAAAGLVSGEDVGAATPEVVPAPSNYLSYRVYSKFEFRTGTLANPTLTSEVATAPGGRLILPLALPMGVVVREIMVTARNAVANTFRGFVYRQAINGATGDLVEVTIPANTALSDPVTVQTNFTIAGDSYYTLEFEIDSSSRGVDVVRVGYLNAMSYVTVNPYRAFDSRPVVGRFAPGSRRSIDLGQLMNPSGVIVSTGLIPANARAVAVNITAVQATGANNFSATAGDNIFPDQAALVVFNSTTPTVANTATVPCFNRQINVHTGSGPGSAHCVVDVLGYYI